MRTRSMRVELRTAHPQIAQMTADKDEDGGAMRTKIEPLNTLNTLKWSILFILSVVIGVHSG
jgi:hypothetical protein